MGTCRGAEEWRTNVGPRTAGGRSRSSSRRSIRTRRRWPKSSASSPAIRRSCSPAKRASSSGRSAAAAAGEAFLLQGGDCAESFGEHSADNIRDFFRVFLQMAVVMTFAAASPIVKVGRVAGQFAKPRSSDVETIDGVSLPSYRGDIVNDIDFTAEAREPDPRRQLEAYRQSAATLNLLRAFATGGYANLENAHRWMLGFVKDSPQSERYQERRRPDHRDARLHARHRPRPRGASGAARDRFLHLARGAAARLRAGDDAARLDLGRLLRDLRPPGLDRRPHPPARRRACRILPRASKNPIGLKCGPSLDPDELLRLIDVLDPDGEPGRLTLICRFGADKVEAALPPLVRAVKREGRTVLWVCDPMHGNTIKTSTGYKTRPTERIASGSAQLLRDLPRPKASTPAASISR